MMTEKQVREFKKVVETTPVMTALAETLQMQTLATIEYILQERAELEL